MRIVDPLTDSRWDEKLLAHDDATIFHTAAWARVLRDSYGYSCCYLTEADGDRILFLLPVMEVRSLLTGKRGISLPFTDFCEPLMARGFSGEDVLDALKTRGREQGWKYFELRGGEPLFGAHPPATTVLEHTLDLSASEDVLFAGVKESTRRNIKKARREGLEVTVGTTKEMVESFYRLNCLTRRDHGLPPQPLSFFRNLHKHLIGKGHGFVALVAVGGTVAGGAVFLHFGHHALYKYGASDRRLLSLRPNDLVMWDALRRLHVEGRRLFSFGRTELHHEGLRRYKIAWGARERRRSYYRYLLASAQFSTLRPSVEETSSAILRRLPLGVLRAVGSALYRHVA